MADGHQRLALRAFAIDFSSNPEFPSGIEPSMRRLRLGIYVVLTVVFVSAVLFATAGSFRGVIVHGPDINPGWIWVRGANGSLRKVNIAHAHVEYNKSVPAAERASKPEAGVKAGAEVRITADQDANGEWRALKIEILKTKTDEPVITPAPRDMSNIWMT